MKRKAQRLISRSVAKPTVLAAARPELCGALSADEFAAWYWLKEELVAFCRANSISPTGSKPELNARIADFLARRAPARYASIRRSTAAMSEDLSLDSVIGEGWRCGPKLGAFLRSVVGNGFHFNAATRDFIHNGAGRTLADAAICYQESLRPGRKKSHIPQQLEYNRHFRKYFREHPGASREEAIAAWWARRSRRQAAT